MRLDEWFVHNQLFPSRSRAIRFIRENGVRINDKLVKKPAYRVKTHDKIETKELIIQRFGKPVGYHKIEFLSSNLDFPLISPKDQCLDIGANVGGFSIFMLENNVDSVLAIEISPQYEPSLREIKEQWSNFSYRIANFFEVNIDNFSPQSFSLITADLTLDPFFLLENLDRFNQLLQPTSISARLLLTIKTGKVSDPQGVIAAIEQKIPNFFPDSSHMWLKSLPGKQEHILLIIRSY